MQHCPSCGQRLAMRAGPKVDLGTNTLFFDNLAIHLTPSEAELLSVLLEHAPSVVSWDQLRIGIWGFQDGPENPDACIRTWIYNLQPRLKSADMQIIRHWGRGFSLTWRTMAMEG